MDVKPELEKAPSISAASNYRDSVLNTEETQSMILPGMWRGSGGNGVDFTSGRGLDVPLRSQIDLWGGDEAFRAHSRTLRLLLREKCATPI